MTTFINTLIPIMLLIVIGFILKRIQFLPEQTWSGIEKLTYYLLFPALLIKTLANQSLNGTPWPTMLIVVSATIMISASLLILLRKRLAPNNATFTSIFQGGVRFNTYITLAIAQGLYGATGLAMGSVVAGFMIVLINLWCILVFVLWGKASLSGAKQLFTGILANPLIVACAVGWLLSLTGIGLNTTLADTLAIVSRGALPLGLLAVGAAIRLDGIKAHFKAIALSSLAQFVLKPFLCVALIYCTGLTGIAASVIIIAFMTPTAPSAYIIARQLGGDSAIMASIITVQTLCAFLLMPLLAACLL